MESRAIETLPLSQVGVVKSPATHTAAASGAQQRNVQPPVSRTAPIPDDDAGAMEEFVDMAYTPDLVAKILLA
jgi:hypothetical protein